MLGRRAPTLAELAVRASLGGAGSTTAQAALRDELIRLARECSDVSWRAMRRGVDELDAATRPAEAPTPHPHRPYRVKP